MIFEDLKFRDLPNGNKLSELLMDNGYSLDIVKRMKTRDYKVKSFEETHGKKRYNPYVFPEYGEYPTFNSRDALVVFLNEISKHDLSDVNLDNVPEIDFPEDELSE